MIMIISTILALTSDSFFVSLIIDVSLHKCQIIQTIKEL